MIYANHAGTSWPKPPGVVEAVQAALTVEPSQTAALYRDAHAAVAGFFDLGAPQRLLFASSCTAALALVLGDLAWQPGDVVVTSSLEHHALARGVQKLAAERGVGHVRIPYRPGRPVDLDAVEATLRAGRVRLLAMTGASNITGECLPLPELVALAHAHGAWFLLDAAQVAGVLPLSVAGLGVDLLVFASHKGMLGPLGIGGLWAAPHVTFTCPSAVCEVGPAVATRTGPFPGFCDVGSVNLPAAAGLAAALRWQQARTAEERARPVALARRLRAACGVRGGVRVLGGDVAHTATVALALDRLPLARAEAHFRAHGIVVRAGQHCAPMALAALGQPEGCLRLSFGWNNTEADVARVLAAIEAVG